ncbi:DUF3885 domain-containing protein [Staphylococcus aureus]
MWKARVQSSFFLLHTIFHVYDDRGCDSLGTSPESI